MTAIAELHAPPEVLEAIRSGRRSGLWIRAKCPFCDPAGRKRPNLAASHTGFGKHRDRPGWVCHACHAEQDMRRAAQQRMQLRYDPAARQNDAKRRTEAAIQIIERSTSISEGDPIDLYLRGRGLRPPAALWPGALRKAYLRHPETKKTYPAMVGVVTNSANMTIAVHRTFLTEDGRKADVNPTRLSLGPVSGGAVRLGIDSEVIVISEGIESALGAAMALQIVPWAALSAGNMAVLDLPKSVKRVVIAPDNDVSDNPRKDEVGLRFAMKLRTRLKELQVAQDRIIDITIRFPPTGRTDFADFG